MNLNDPLQAILMYFAILFAPDNVDKMTIEAPRPMESIELIRNPQPIATSGKITINVLGQVMEQGAYELSSSATVRDAISAAGGPATNADLKNVSIARGPAGAVPKITLLDLTNAEAENLQILTSDTIYVVAKAEGKQMSKEATESAIIAERWLAGIDGGDYEGSWKSASEFFQKNLTAVAWSEAMTKFRKPLGQMKSRKFRDMKVATALPGAPDGEYRIIQFETSFSEKAEAVERVTLMLEKDGSWKSSGFFIR